MLHISTQKLIEKLLERTRNGTIDWKERAPEGVVLHTEGYVVELIPAPLSVRLLQENGRLLEDVTEDLLTATQNKDGHSFAELTIELLREADRFARGTEQAIASILDAVEALDTPILKKRPTETISPPAPAPAIETLKIDADAEILAVSSEVEEIAFEVADTEDNPIEEPIEIALPALDAVEDVHVDFDLQEPEKIEITPPSVPIVEHSFSEADMSAAVSKMVAEINGFDPDTVSTPEEDMSISTTATQIEIKHEVELESPSIKEMPIETRIETVEDVQNDMHALNEEKSNAPDDDMDLPVFKTHIVATPDAKPIPPASTNLMVEQPIEAPAEATTEVFSVPEIEPDFEFPSVELDEIAGLPDLPSIEELNEAPAELVNIADVGVPSPPEEIVSIVEMNTIEESSTPLTAPHQPAYITEIHAKAEAPKEQNVEETPPTVGFSFFNKVTATGLAVGSKLGTLVPGVPDDIQKRVEEHEKAYKQRSEQQAANLEKQRQIDEERARQSAQRASIGFKSWS